MLTPKGYTNAQCTRYNYLKFQAGKVMVALVCQLEAPNLLFMVTTRNNPFLGLFGFESVQL